MMDEYKTISYIIPAYNMEKYIRKCIFSIFMQDYPDHKIEIVVVNDASTDDTIERIEDVFNDLFDNENKLGNYQCVGGYQIINLKNNSGPGKALNIGFKAANGDYLCFLSADDYLVNDKKTIDQYIAMEHYNSDLCYYENYVMGYSNERDSHIPSRLIKRPDIFMKQPFLFNYLFPNREINNNLLFYLLLNIRNSINSSSLMFKKESYFKYGEWDPNLRADCDADMLFKYALHDAKISKIKELPDPIYYRIHPNQVSNQTSLMSKSSKYNRLKYKKEIIDGDYPLWLKLAVRGLIR